MAQMYAYLVHKEGALDDSAAELAAAAQKIDPNAQVTGIVAGHGADLDNTCKAAAKFFDQVWKFEHPDLAYPNAEVVRKLLAANVQGDALVLIAHDHFGMDLAPGLSIRLDSTYAADVVAIDGLNGTTLTVVRQEYAGMAHVHVACDIAKGAVLTLRPGVFQSKEEGSRNGRLVEKSCDAGELRAERRFIEVLGAETGDVDITKADVLVSIGRGIEDQDNIELAEELAEGMGAVLSCSRPIVDAKWLEKSRQVGTSGKTVKPKVYLALGISGSFQHLGGIKGSPFIVGVNKNAKAPIFQVADVGNVEDILEFIPALTETIQSV
jgi:electron transfer flavoprotein alpha subunit